MVDKAFVYIVVILSALKGLSTLLETIKVRAVDLAAERKTKTFTTRCSRRGLLVIA